MKRLLLIIFLSILCQCSWFSQQLTIPQTLKENAISYSISQPMLHPMEITLLPSEPSPFNITINAMEQGKPQVFKLQWQENTRLETWPEFLMQLSPGSQLDFHDIITHQVVLYSTSGHHRYTMQFAITRTGTLVQNTAGSQTETAIADVLPQEIPILKDGQPIGKIHVRLCDWKTLLADVWFYQEVWHVHYQSFMGSVQCQIDDSQQPLAFFQLKPGGKFISKHFTGTVYLKNSVLSDDLENFLVTYLFSQALYIAQHSPTS